MKSLLALGGVAADAAGALIHFTLFPAQGTFAPWTLLCLSGILPLAYGLTRSAFKKFEQMPEVIRVETRRLVDHESA